MFVPLLCKAMCNWNIKLFQHVFVVQCNRAICGYKQIDCSNEEFSTNESQEVVLVIRSAQSSIVGVAFRRFSKSF